MNKAKIISLFLFVFTMQECNADCIPISISLDTLQPGVVKITTCIDFPSPTCTVDTESVRKLMKALIDSFSNNSNVVIAHIESTFVTGPYSPFWGTESVYVAIDTVLKGNCTASKQWFIHQLWEDSGLFGSMRHKKFIGLFNEIKPDNVLGIGEPTVCYDTFHSGSGYFIDSGNIINTGINALLGVSVPLQEWLNAVSHVYRVEKGEACTDGIPPECSYFIGGVVDTASKTNRPVGKVIDTAGIEFTVDSSIVVHQTPVRGFFIADTFFITEILGPATSTKQGVMRHYRQEAGKPSTVMAIRGAAGTSRSIGAGRNGAIVDFRGRMIAGGEQAGQVAGRTAKGIYVRTEKTK
jgi:hypothetical protein